ncbi:MAG: KpsF/GutQ family sugar-phosphate isomerase [Planctomycetaceae bacterium]
MHAAHQSVVIPSAEVEQLREARDMLRHAAQELTTLSRRLDTSFCAAVTILAECRGTLVITGMGKAGHIARKLAATFSSTGTRAQFLHPAEAVHGDLGCLAREDVVLALSNSGETEELCRLLPYIRQIGPALLALTAKATSSVGRAADVVLALGSIREGGHQGLAPTTSATAMLALGDALALVVSRTRGFTREQFGRLHPAGNLGRLCQGVADLMRSGDQLRIAPETATIREVLVGKPTAGRRTGAVMLVDADGRLSGVFTDSDLARLLEGRRDAQLDRPIGESMTPCPKCISCGAPLSDAVDLLSQYRISELPVVDGAGCPVGLIDITDLIGLVPEERAE